MSNGCCIACYHCQKEAYLDKIGWEFSSERENLYLKGYLDIMTHLLNMEEWDVGSPELVNWVKTEVSNFLGEHQNHLVYLRSDDDIRYTENQRSPSVHVSKQGRQFAQTKGWITALELSPDNQYIAVASYPDILQIYQVKTGELVQEFLTQQTAITALAFYPDSLHLASGGKDGTIKAWKILTAEPLSASACIDKNYEMEDNSISSLAFLPAQNQLISADIYYPSILNIWHPKTFKNNNKKSQKIPAISHRKPLQLSSSPDGKYLGVAPEVIAFSPDGLTIASVAYEGESWQTYRCFLKIWDLATQEIIFRLPITEGKHDKVYYLTFSPDGNEMAAAIAEIKQYEELKEGQRIPDLYWYESNVIKLINIAEKKMSEIFTGHTGIISGLQFSQDGCHLWSGGYDSQVIIWDRETSLNEDQVAKVEPSKSLKMSLFNLSEHLTIFEL